MRHPTSHRKLLILLCLMLALVTGGLGVASGLAGAAPRSRTPAQEAFDRVVTGMTRADDLAGLGFGAPVILSGVQAAARLPGRGGRVLAACLKARAFCSGYLFHAGAGRDAVLLVMEGRIVFKGFAA